MFFNNFFRSSVLICLVLSVCVTQSLSDVESLGDATPRTLQAALSTGTLIPTSFTHKPGDTDVIVTVGFQTASLSGTIMQISPPSGYTVKADCSTTQLSATVPVRVDLNGVQYQATGPQQAQEVRQCNADIQNRAVVTFTATLPNVSGTNMLAVKFVLSNTPMIAITNNVWTLTYGSATTTLSGPSVNLVGGWLSTFALPSGSIGSPSASGPVMRPTRVKSDSLVDVAFYMRLSTTVAKGHSFVMALPANLTTEMSGSCLHANVKVTTQLCTDQSCSVLTLGDVQNNVIDGGSQIGCTSGQKSLTFLADTAITSSQGIYVTAKLRTAEQDEEMPVGQVSVYTCQSNSCPVPADYNTYLKTQNYVDHGKTLDDVRIQTAGALKRAYGMFLAVLLVISCST